MFDFALLSEDQSRLDEALSLLERSVTLSIGIPTTARTLTAKPKRTAGQSQPRSSPLTMKATGLGLALAIAVQGLNLLGNGLRDI